MSEQKDTIWEELETLRGKNEQLTKERDEAHKACAGMRVMFKFILTCDWYVGDPRIGDACKAGLSFDCGKEWVHGPTVANEIWRIATRIPLPAWEDLDRLAKKLEGETK